MSRTTRTGTGPSSPAGPTTPGAPPTPRPTDWPGPSIDRPAGEALIEPPPTDWDGPLAPPVDFPEPEPPGTDRRGRRG